MSSRFLADITALFEDEQKLNILFILNMFGPLNLEKISELLQKPKSTIHGHLVKMIQQNQIVLDSETTVAKRGKYYNISPEVAKLFKNQEEIAVNKEMFKELNISKERFLKRIANVQRSIGYQAALLASLSAAYIEHQVEALDNLDKKSDKLMGFYAGIYELEITSQKKWTKFHNLLEEFSKQLKEFEAKDQQKANLILFVQTNPIDKIGPS